MEKPQLHSYSGGLSVSVAQAVSPSNEGDPPQQEHPPQQGYSPSQQSVDSLPEKYPLPPSYGYPQTPQPNSVPDDLSEPPPGPRRSWWEEFRRNIPQSASLSAASLIFTSGGMSLAWGVNLATSYMSNSRSTQKHMRACWFIGIIVGACIAAFLINRVSKRLFYLAGSILVIINGILFLPTPLSVPAVTAARYCDGIAFGLVLVPVIMAGSEQAAFRFRALVLSVEQASVATGIMIKVIYTTLWVHDWDFYSDQMHGVLAILIGVLAILFTFTLTIESSSTFLRKNDETGAVNAIRKLETPQMGVNEAYTMLYENKRMLDEDAARGMAENITRGLVPVIKLSIFRSLVSMSISLPLTYGFDLLSWGYTNPFTSWTMCLYTVMRLVGVLVAVFTMDSVGRKKVSVSAVFICGSLLMGIGSLFSNVTEILLIIYELSAGILAPVSTCYLGEAFSHSVKPYFILCAIVIENLVQIIISVSAKCSYRSVADFDFAFGALSIAFSILFYTMMPETKGTTLREALVKFGKFDYLLDKVRDRVRLFVTQRLSFITSTTLGRSDVENLCT